jgi:hypothetical protein
MMRHSQLERLSRRIAASELLRLGETTLPCLVGHNQPALAIRERSLQTRQVTSLKEVSGQASTLTS